MRFNRTIKLLVAVLAVGLPFAVAGPASARTPVDPSSLNPPLPDFFNGVCNQLGTNILCTLGFTDEPIIDEPSGVVCDGTEISYSQKRSVVGKRTYSAAGDRSTGVIQITGTAMRVSTALRHSWRRQRARTAVCRAELIQLGERLSACRHPILNRNWSMT